MMLLNPRADYLDLDQGGPTSDTVRGQPGRFVAPSLQVGGLNHGSMLVQLSHSIEVLVF